MLFEMHPLGATPDVTPVPMSTRLDFLGRSSVAQAIHWWKAGDVVLVAALFVFYYAYGQGTPFARQFSIDDLTIAHPFAEKERVPDYMLMVYSFVVPIVVIGVLSPVFHRSVYGLRVAYLLLLGWAVGFFTNAVVTTVLKNHIGRLRPDFLARCVPKEGTPRGVMVMAADVCTTTNLARLTDGFRTTPSGHSSYSFAGLGFLALWLYGQMDAGSPEVLALRTLVAGVPVLGAALIAISRTEDYRHHFVDVLIGLVFGSVAAWWAYHRVFPATNEPNSGVPLVGLVANEYVPADSLHDPPHEAAS